MGSPLPPYNPLVVVKFRDSVRLPYEDIDLVGLHPQRYLRSWLELENQFPGITIQRRITSLTAQQLVAIVKEARQLDPNYSHPDNFFLTYFGLFCPLGIGPKAVVDALRSPIWAREVELAYLEGRCSSPSPQPGTTSEKIDSLQKYLLPAPDGIDARYAWTFTGGDGGGPAGDLRFLDIERGWKLDHSDLPPGIQMIHGSSQQSSKNHGTAVLGIVLGVPNDTGIVGITPNVATTKVASWVPAGPSSGFVDDLENAIAAAIEPSVLQPGDVLLLEVERIAPMGYTSASGWKTNTYKVPVEVDRLVLDMIQNAVSRQIVVVEAAGNGGLDLDTYTHDSWLGTTSSALVRHLNTNLPEFTDSSAILVGAAHAAPPHAPITFTQGSTQHKMHNYGSRINCYAWGERIYTTGVKSDGTDDYVIFNDTSGAAAIIAGAALAIQGIAQAYGKGDLPNGRYSPLALRNILRDRDKGTPSSTPMTDKIGVMPDLRAIINTKLGLHHVQLAKRGGYDIALALPEIPPNPDPGPLHNRRIAKESTAGGPRVSKKSRLTKGGRR